MLWTIENKGYPLFLFCKIIRSNMKRIYLLSMLFIFVLTGCSNVSLETVEPMLDNYFESVGVTVVETEITEHRLITQYSFQAKDADETVKYEVEYYQLDDEASKSGFHSEAPDVYSGVKSVGICKTSRSVIVFKLYEEDGVWSDGDKSYAIAAILEDDQEAINAAVKEINASCTYRTIVSE